jgi:peptidyl-prolyl cis-trans isomerase D
VLANLRKYSSSRGIKVLYALLAVSFIGWGVGASRQAHLDVVARVHGQRITRHDLDARTNALQNRFQELTKGANVPVAGMLRGEALDQLVDDALLRNEADRLGLDVSDQDVTNAITTMPELQRDGRFDRDLLERVLELNRDRGEFEAQVRQGLVDRRVRALVLDGVQVSDAEIAERYGQDREQVDLFYVRIPADELAKTATVSDEDVAKWVADHPDRYRTPPRVRVSYIAYSPKDFVTLAAPSDDAVKAYYDAHVEDRFTTPEQVHARHILIKLAPGADEKARAEARKKAEDVLAEVKAGSDFAALAKKESQDPGSASKGGDLGLFARGRMVPPFEAAAFALEPGGVSDIVETPFGFHIIKVDEKVPGGQKPLEEVRGEIVKTLTDEKGLDLARQQAESDRRDVVRGKSLAEIAGSRLKETPPFAAGEDIPGVGKVKAFSDAAFALGPNEPSDLVEGEDVIYLLEPTERLEPTVPPVAELGSRPVDDLKRSRGEALAKEKAEKLLARAKEIGLQKAAAETGVTVEETGNFERQTGTIPKLSASPELRGDSFTLTAEQPLAPRVYAAGGDSLVVALKERTPADLAGLNDAKDSLRQTLLQQKQQDALHAFMNHLKERAQKEGALEVKADAVTEG